MGYLAGFKVTFKKLFEERVTTEYPKEKRPKPPRFHGRHVLNRYEDGMEKCTGASYVVYAQLTITSRADNPETDPVSSGERYGYVYEINYLAASTIFVLKLLYEAITESKLFEFSFSNRNDAIYTKDELVVGDDGLPNVNLGNSGTREMI